MNQDQSLRLIKESSTISEKLKSIGCKIERISYYWWRIVLPNGNRLQLQFERGSWILKPRGASNEYPQIQKVILLAVANRFMKRAK